jgi:hypothetical protein
MPPNQPEIREDEVRNPGVSYEPREADLSVVLWFLAALGLAAVLVLLVLWGMFGYFRGKSAERGPLPSPRMYTSAPSVPQPRLQPNPVADYDVYRSSDQETLNSYGWVDRKAGIARIPIDRAMDLVAVRGLPWKTSAPAPGAGTAPNPAVEQLPGASRAQQDMSRTNR